MYTFIFFVAAGLIMVGCTSEREPAGISVSVVAEGRERTFQLTESMTVDQFLSQIEVEYDENDRLTPPRFTQISDGMRITIVRVTEETRCERQEIPYEQEIVRNEGLDPEEERIAQVGKNGEQEVCYRTIIEDGVPREQVQIGQPTIITEPVNEILVVGMDAEVEPIPITGTLAYINNGNAWVIKGNSTSKKPLTTSGNLDSMVLSLSPDGQYLLYTAKPDDEEAFVNELWLIDSGGERPEVQLTPTDVLYAEWVPLQENTISYSTGEVRQIAPFWRALNNLWTARIDPNSGQSLNPQKILDETNSGLDAWWGTVFSWSPDGETVAYGRAGEIGVVTDGELTPLVEYPTFRTLQNWSWRSGLSWSWDGELLALTSHGPPLGSEPPETSPVFDVIITDNTGAFTANVFESAGIWAAPRFSPTVEGTGEEIFARGYLAYFQAREPYASLNGEYDLVVADRDGSNARVVFPGRNQAGIKSTDVGLTPQDFTWSPDGRQIALIYRGNLWVVDVQSTVAHQLTFDGGAQHPVWSR